MVWHVGLVTLGPIVSLTDAPAVCILFRIETHID